MNPATGALQYKSTDILLKVKWFRFKILLLCLILIRLFYMITQIKHTIQSYVTDLYGNTILGTFYVSQYNDYTEQEIRSEMGTGWSFGFPFIETSPNSSQTPLYLHMGDGSAYKLNGTQIVIIIKRT